MGCCGPSPTFSHPGVPRSVARRAARHGMVWWRQYCLAGHQRFWLSLRFQRARPWPRHQSLGTWKLWPRWPWTLGTETWPESEQKISGTRGDTRNQPITITREDAVVSLKNNGCKKRTVYSNIRDANALTKAWVNEWRLNGSINQYITWNTHDGINLNSTSNESTNVLNQWIK